VSCVGFLCSGREDPAVVFEAIIACGHFVAVDLGLDADVDADNADLGCAVLGGVDGGVAVDPEASPGGLVEDPGRDVADLAEFQVANDGGAAAEVSPPQGKAGEGEDGCGGGGKQGVISLISAWNSKEWSPGPRDRPAHSLTRSSSSGRKTNTVGMSVM